MSGSDTEGVGLCVFIKKHWGIVVVVADFIINIFFSGVIYGYNLLHVEFQETFNATATESAIPGAISIALFTCSSVVVTLLFQTLGHRITVVLGVSLCCLGLLISSFVESIAMLCLTYGVLYGFGYNAVNVTSIDMILRNVDKRNASRATCTAFCGASVGVLLAPCLDWMYVTYSWRVSLRILCVLLAIIGYLSALVMVEINPAVVEEPNKIQEEIKITLPIQNKSFVARCIDVFRRRDFLVATPGFMLTATAMSFTFIGVGSFLVDAGMSNSSISLILALMGVADLCSRIGAALFSDIVPISRTVQYAVINFIAAIPSVCLPFIMSSNGRMAALIVLSVPRALLAVLLPTVVMELSREERRAEAMGLSFMMFGLGTFATPYVTDTMYDITGSYDIAWFICTGLYALAGIFMSIAAWDRSNHELNRMRYDQVEKDEREVEL